MVFCYYMLVNIIGGGETSNPQIQPFCMSGENNFVKYILAVILLQLEGETCFTQLP